MRIAWPRLMRLGLVELRLAPEVFWSLTPAELMLMAGLDRPGSGAMDRSVLESLMARYPDRGSNLPKDAEHVHL
jgi:uncharacterized phage protein (TIGR02216 family)